MRQPVVHVVSFVASASASAQGKTDEPQPQSRGGKNIEGAGSDRAQLSTIAMDALAFSTAGFYGSLFLLPIKGCDYSGFQYRRRAGNGGHKTDFLTNTSRNLGLIPNAEDPG